MHLCLLHVVHGKMDVEERVDRLLEPALSCLVRVRAEGAGALNGVLYG